MPHQKPYVTSDIPCHIRNPTTNQKSYDTSKILNDIRNPKPHQKSNATSEVLCHIRNPTTHQKSYVTSKILRHIRNPTPHQIPTPHQCPMTNKSPTHFLLVSSLWNEAKPMMGRMKSFNVSESCYNTSIKDILYLLLCFEFIYRYSYSKHSENISYIVSRRSTKVNVI